MSFNELMKFIFHCETDFDLGFLYGFLGTILLAFILFIIIIFINYYFDFKTDYYNMQEDIERIKKKLKIR